MDSYGSKKNPRPIYSSLDYRFGDTSAPLRRRLLSNWYLAIKRKTYQVTSGIKT